jgi:2-dehydro-3-deoxyphosphooctonate aldolase (KDO 8-P synthase)
LAPGVTLGGGADASALPVIAGPCVIESVELLLTVARRLDALRQRLQFPIIFKSTYDKANRSSISSFRGPGLLPRLDA